MNDDRGKVPPSGETSKPATSLGEVFSELVEIARSVHEKEKQSPAVESKPWPFSDANKREAREEAGEMISMLGRAGPDAKERLLMKWMRELNQSVEQGRKVNAVNWPEVAEPWGPDKPLHHAEKMWSFCRETVEKHGRTDTLMRLEEHKQFLDEQLEKARRDLERLRSIDRPLGKEKHGRVARYQTVFQIQRRALLRFQRKFAETLGMPKLTKQDVGEIVRIAGYNAPDYAREARDALNKQSGVSSFSKLAAKLGAGGESKVDTLKRATSYDDLPREEKSFERFKELLFAAEIT